MDLVAQAVMAEVALEVGTQVEAMQVLLTQAEAAVVQVMRELVEMARVE
jgi:hypothetical protein